MKLQQRSQEENVTEWVEFVLLGFCDVPHLRWFLFGFFLLIYMVILLGNGIIILITKVDSTLHIPMYFFLANFSSLEICYVSVILPRMLRNLGTERRAISLFSCATQMFCFLTFGATECFLLAAMAYDRYVAICNPLNYPVIMNHKVCSQLVAACWISGVPVQMGQTLQIFSLPFCGSNQINHFFCDIPPVLRLACGEIFVNEMMVYLAAVVLVSVPFVLILTSYIKIISTVCKLPSATSRAKAFSTCSSHLTVVMLFFGSAIITYLRPNSTHSAGTDKVLSLFYTVLTPTFNPMIYTLRNKDVTIALGRLLGK
ncbi:olfactory receptor 10AG1-like [Ochotona curzoniae]|uniref:olfactory receptor 10AG1-like n=1 Tax=Ochotona curzoniae TaxID=130825 RepID=UPI001B350D4A|nr:olfactory receptor 10AG1-like [Ochotona curzoniae]